MELNFEIVSADSEQARTDVEVKVVDKDSGEAAPAGAANRGKSSKYAPISDKWAELSGDQALLIEGLGHSQVQSLSDHMFNRFDRDDVAVRRAEKEDGTYRVAICAREDEE